MLWVAVGIFWVAFLVGFYVVCKPRFEAIERQRDVVGNREIPRPAKRLIAARSWRSACGLRESLRLAGLLTER